MIDALYMLWFKIFFALKLTLNHNMYIYILKDLLWSDLSEVVTLFFLLSAFTFLFAVMEPVPWQLKIAFHFFGFGSLILGMVLFASTLASITCVSILVIDWHKLSTRAKGLYLLSGSMLMGMRGKHYSKMMFKGFFFICAIFFY